MTKTVNGAPITAVSRGYRIIPAVSITMQTSSRHSHEYILPLETATFQDLCAEAVPATSQCNSS